MNNFLDLSDADTSGFAAVDAGRYNAEVFSIKWDATNNPNGKVPVGTPLMKVQFRLTDEPNENRRVFDQFVSPPADYDAKKKATMNGMIANFFIAIGFKEEEVKSATFAPDFEELQGTPCVVVLNKVNKKNRDGSVIEDEWTNEVKGIKPAGSIVTNTEAAADGLL